MKKLAIGLVTSAALLSFVAMAQENGAKRLVTGLPSNHGQTLCTADVNSDGSMAGGLDATGSTRLSAGNYQVSFGGACGSNITAANGYARFVQVDTLTTGALPGITCTTADRAGVPSAVFIECFNSAGTATDASFFLAVTR